MKNINFLNLITEKIFDFKNLKKDTFLFLGIIWVIIIAIFALMSLRLNYLYNENKKKMGLQKKAKIESLDVSNYTKLLEKMINPEKISYYNLLLERDIFSETKTPVVVELPPVFEIKAIERLPLSLMYKGFIQYENGILIAQINFDGVTKFVKKGDKIKDYKILEVSKDHVVILTPDNLKVPLRQNKIAFGGEYQVSIFDSANKKTYSLKKNDLLIGIYKLFDIKDDSVILLKDGEKIILKKGERLNG